MVVGKILVPLKLKVPEHFFKESADSTGCIRFEGNEPSPASVHHGLKVFIAGVGIVGTYFLDGESLAGCFEQWLELRMVTGILVENTNGGYHVRFNSASNVYLDPNAF